MDETDLKLKRAKRKARLILLWALAAAVFLAAGAVFLRGYTDVAFFIPEPKNVEYAFRCDNRNIQRRDGDEWEDFIVRGVEFSDHQNDADYEDYFRWLTSIAELNANAVRVHALMPPDFYRALYDVNAGGTELFLIQGVELSDETFANMTDMVSGDMVGLFKKEGRAVIDAVHAGGAARGYTSDVSQMTLAYIVGDEWDGELVAYTNHVNAGIAGDFTGSYAGVWNTSNAATTLIARAVDDVFSYETRKYAQQHIVGVGNGQSTDNLFHDSTWAVGLDENVAQVYTAHIYGSSRVRTGVFAALRVETGVMQNLSYDPAYISYTDGDGRKNPVRYYLESLYYAHRIPLLLGGTSMSAARGSSGVDAVFGYDRGGVGEEVQAEGLCFVYSQAVEAGYCGGCAGYYLDDPNATAWNSEKLTEHSDAWLDAEDSEQSLGIVALEPGESAKCVVNGKTWEWGDAPVISEGDGMRLYAMGDEKYLYLRVHVDDYDPQNDVIYIPLDVTPLSGAAALPSQNLSFGRDMDFLLTVNGTKRAKLTVSEYYEPVEAVNKQELDYEYWFVSPPDKHSDVFTDTVQYVRPALFPNEGNSVSAELAVSGILRYGNADPDSPDYDSRADYCIYGSDIELRVPWALLNFTDPSKGEILGDFYTGGVYSLAIDKLYMELHVYKDQTMVSCPAGALELPCYEGAVYRERPRAAYDAVCGLFEEYT